MSVGSLTSAAGVYISKAAAVRVKGFLSVDRCRTLSPPSRVHHRNYILCVNFGPLSFTIRAVLCSRCLRTSDECTYSGGGTYPTISISSRSNNNRILIRFTRRRFCCPRCSCAVLRHGGMLSFQRYHLSFCSAQRLGVRRRKLTWQTVCCCVGSVE